MSEQHNQEHGSKTITIIVNGRPQEYGQAHISYEQLVQIAYPAENPDPTITYTVTYSSPHGKDGTLVAGQKVEVKNGMSFHVAKTHRS